MGRLIYPADLQSADLARVYFGSDPNGKDPNVKRRVGGGHEQQRRQHTHVNGGPIKFHHACRLMKGIPQSWGDNWNINGTNHGEYGGGAAPGEASSKRHVTQCIPHTEKSESAQMLTSQTHQVPHMGLPHMDPVASARR